MASSPEIARLSPEAFAARLVAFAATLEPGQRHIVALAGPPGAGKSTLAAQLVEALRADASADILPMDGYHYDDELLTALGRLERKGAPDTFDVGGFAAMLARLSANAEHAIAVPRFDRDLEIARAGARLIAQETQIIIVEGNYLLLNEPPWDALAPHFHLTAMIEVPQEELARRLTDRWQGYDLPPQEIRRKVEENDLPNGRFVMDNSRPADITIIAPAAPTAG